MSYDPYGDEVDADIFSDEDGNFEAEDKPLEDQSSHNGHKHTIDGSMCPTCNVQHPDIMESLDPRAKEAFLTFLDSMPPSMVAEMLEIEVGRSNNRPQAEMLTGFLSFANRIDQKNTMGPVLRSIVDYLDEQTDGKITRKWRVYEQERRLVITHKMIKGVKEALEESHDEDHTPNKHMLGLIEMILDYMLERLELIKEKYHEACYEAEMEPNSEILETGIYSGDYEKQVMADQLYEELVVR